MKPPPQKSRIPAVRRTVTALLVDALPRLQATTNNSTWTPIDGQRWFGLWPKMIDKLVDWLPESTCQKSVIPPFIPGPCSLKPLDLSRLQRVSPGSYSRRRNSRLLAFFPSVIYSKSWMTLKLFCETWGVSLKIELPTDDQGCSCILEQ